MLRQAMEMMLRNSTRVLVEAVGGKREKRYRWQHKIGILEYLKWKLDISGVTHTIRCKDFYLVLLQSLRSSVLALQVKSSTREDTVFVLELE